MSNQIPQTAWEETWTVVDAVRFLVMNGERLRGDNTLASRVNPLLSQWFMGQDAPLLSDEHLRVLAPNLLETLSLLRANLQEVGLDHSSHLLSVLWIRLFCNHGIVIQPRALIGFAWWLCSSEAKGDYFLYRYLNEDRKYVGPPHEPSGKRGRTALDLAFGNLPATIAGKEYVAEWRVKKITIEPKAANASGQRISGEVPQLKAAQQSSRAESNAIALKKQGKPKKRRNIAALKKLYGTNCVDLVREVLASLVKRKNSLVYSGPMNARPYSTALSLPELASELKRKEKSISRYADSTLKPVLGYFVSAPRGRPPSL
jgi:hypothetical protein